METELSPKTLKTLLKFQQDEENSFKIYAFLSKRGKSRDNKEILQQMSTDEARHASVWREYTKNKKIRPQWWVVLWYKLLAVLLGFTFVSKRLEKGEKLAVSGYKKLGEEIPEALRIMDEEAEHENKLVEMLDEERLKYVGAMVLGLNDALVELSGSIAGFTFALQNNRLIALSAIIVGIAATLSMATSNYLAERAAGNAHPLKASLYTGIAYLVTVVLLIVPYFIFPNEMFLAAFIVMLVVMLLIIIFFNYYISVAKSQPFFKQFGTMAAISLSVAAISFGIGLLAKTLLGVDV